MAEKAEHIAMITVFESLGLASALTPKLPPNLNEKSFKSPDLPLLETAYSLKLIDRKSATFIENLSNVMLSFNFPIAKPLKIHRAYRSGFVSTKALDEFIVGLAQDHLGGYDFCIVRLCIDVSLYCIP